LASLAGIALLVLSPGIRAQDKKKPNPDKTQNKKSDPDKQDKKNTDSDSVRFDSVDGVELRGSFYPAAKAKSPAVLMLHRYGGNREGWEPLAEKLQKEGFAVLTFDFRGHGESTKVSPDFWKIASNANHIRGGTKADKKTIRYGDFKPDYMPMLVNDIVAAKGFLDKQNDAGLCNSSNVIVIGAEEGAALGCLWTNEEWDRRPKIKRTNLVDMWYDDPQGKPFGEDIVAAIWISPNATLNGKSAGKWLERKEIRDRTSMLFYASSGDSAGAAAAKQLYDDFKKKSKGAEMTFLQDGVKAGKARGTDLVNKKDAQVPDEIAKYLEKVKDKKGENAWRMRATEKGIFINLVDLSRDYPRLMN
jgi:pimeloyl-ACP methyl ester carboxylesterase